MKENDEILYTKLDNYSEIFGLFTMFKSKLRNLKVILSNIDDIRERENSIINNWESSIKDINEKIDFIDEKIKPE